MKQKFSTLTHFLAAAAAATVAFFVSPAGQAVLHQYPHLAPIASGVALIAGLYHSPNA